MRLGGKFDSDEYSAMQVSAQVEMEGVYIELVREPELVDDGEGGVIRPDTAPERTIAQQLFLFRETAPISHVARGTNFQNIIGAGRRATTNFVLVGYSDANVKTDDSFTWTDGYEYKVTAVHPDRTFMTLAEIERVTSGNG